MPGASSREPRLTQNPTDTERCPGIFSVSTRVPHGRTVRMMTAPSASSWTVWVKPLAGSVSGYARRRASSGDPCSSGPPAFRGR